MGECKGNIMRKERAFRHESPNGSLLLWDLMAYLMGETGSGGVMTVLP